MDFASWKDRKSVAQALRAVYCAADAKVGQAALDAFAQSPWGEKYPAHPPQVIGSVRVSIAFRQVNAAGA